MPATKRQFNTRAVTYTPTGGSAVTFTGVTSFAIDPGGSLAMFSGDNDRYPTTTINDFNDPTCTVTAADLAALYALNVGMRGVLSGIIKDAKAPNASSGPGDVTITMNLAIVENVPFTQAHRQFGSGTVTFKTESADGVTSPLSISIV